MKKGWLFIYTSNLAILVAMCSFPEIQAAARKLPAILNHPILSLKTANYVTWTGSLLGEKVSVVSTGIGCPSTAIAVEELIEAGGDTFIRVGSSGPCNLMSMPEISLL
jgi:uridine phosphorylase